MSGTRVAAVLVARNKNGDILDFYGCNIEVARSVVYHAEEVVLIKAITHGFTWPLEVFVTSPSPAHRVPMCLICRGKFSYVNENCLVTVLDEKLEPVLTTSIVDSTKYPYFGKGFIS